jgi:hypothetical protein
MSDGSCILFEFDFVDDKSSRYIQKIVEIIFIKRNLHEKKKFYDGIYLEELIFK